GDLRGRGVQPVAVVAAGGDPESLLLDRLPRPAGRLALAGPRRGALDGRLAPVPGGRGWGDRGTAERGGVLPDARAGPPVHGERLSEEAQLRRLTSQVWFPFREVEEQKRSELASTIRCEVAP